MAEIRITMAESKSTALISTMPSGFSLVIKYEITPQVVNTFSATEIYYNFQCLNILYSTVLQFNLKSFLNRLYNTCSKYLK